MSLLIDVPGGSDDDQQVDDLQVDKEMNSGQEEVDWESFAAGITKLDKELADWSMRGSPNLGVGGMGPNGTRRQGVSELRCPRGVGAFLFSLQKPGVVA